MSLNNPRARELLTKGDLKTLFIEELGWDRHNAHLDVALSDWDGRLNALAEKRGMVVYEWSSTDGRSLPQYALRRKIEHQVAKANHEHLIVFTDTNKQLQVWQWVKREPGKPAACREHTYHRSQPGDALLQKLQSIAFTLSEEESLRLVDVTQRARAGFDVERVTKRFYEQFQKQHAAFLKFVTGITDGADHEWYASVMLNRLMFVYFIQRKGFLDGDRDYLRNRLTRVREEHGRDKFYSFYRYFLLRLFHEGFGARKRTADLDKLLGRIPYLNGGIFDLHELEKPERYGKTIQIPDKAFERIFDYFDQYQWHLDERPLRADNEINPDVLGFIFEKYINQKEMGAYYTKEDITEYISKSTLVPFLLDTTKAKCKVAFENPKGPTVWDRLKDSPDRYIHSSVRHGIEAPFPRDIGKASAAAVDSTLLDQPAPASHGLPSETWRSVLARRGRYAHLRETLVSGHVRSSAELIALNLDVRQFAQDLVADCDGVDLLRAFWQAVGSVSILDPTCGSGAFLFAALNVLEPLYEACLERMEAFVAEADALDTNKAADKYADLRRVLAHLATHPNRRYFIFKSIILNNLFGVDLMEEAVEICKLRLFLKLAAQVEPDVGRDNLGIEPLPDIDFNIRVGNTLVGYATLEEVKRAAASNLDFGDLLTKISHQAADLQEAFDVFRSRQVEVDASLRIGEKQELQSRVAALDLELDRYLAGELGVPASKKQLADWVRTHKPFHWFVEFYGTMRRGGFDVIIGNPPYVEVPKNLNRSLLQSTFKTALDRWSRDEDLYTFIVERSLSLLNTRSGQFGMILPLSLAFSTKRSYVLLREVLAQEQGIWLWSHFDRIPSSLFGNEVRTRCTIAVLSRSPNKEAPIRATSSLLRWNAEYRDYLFANIHYAKLAVNISAGIPKVGSQIQANVLEALADAKAPLGTELTHSIPFEDLNSVAPDFPQPCVYVGGTAYNWFPAWRDIPRTTNRDGEPSLPARTAGYRFASEDDANIVFALLCSSLGYWWWGIASDGFNLKKWLLDRFPVASSIIPTRARKELAKLGAVLRKELKRNYVYKENKGRIGNFYLPACRREVEDIDAFLSTELSVFSRAFFDDIRDFNASLSRAQTTEEEEE